jgi:starvation-inducible DNA-binding protein
MSNRVLNIKPDIDKVETGVEKHKQLAAGLCGALADTYLMMVKTQAFHWNAVGPLFHSVHTLTEEQYRDLFEAADVLAERIRALGYPAPSSITDMIQHSVVEEEMANPSTHQMLDRLADDHENVARRLRDIVDISETNRDVATADLLTGRIAFHEKAIWMLRAMLAE